MNTATQIQSLDINSPVEEILQSKAKFHSDQIEFHKSQLASIKDFLGSQNNGLKNGSKHIQSNNGTTQTISQTIVKPMVIYFLKENRGKHVTTEIYENIKNNQNLVKEERKTIINAISLCLNSLSKGKTPRVKKTDTDNGNIKAYEWVN